MLGTFAMASQKRTCVAWTDGGKKKGEQHSPRPAGRTSMGLGAMGFRWWGTALDGTIVYSLHVYLGLLPRWASVGGHRIGCAGWSSCLGLGISRSR